MSYVTIMCKLRAAFLCKINYKFHLLKKAVYWIDYSQETCVLHQWVRMFSTVQIVKPNSQGMNVYIN